MDYKLLKNTYYCILYVFFPVLQCFVQVLVHVKGLGQSPHQQKLLSAAENPAPETPHLYTHL